MEASLALTSMVRDFEVAEDATQESRRLAERDRDYYDEKQWTAEEKSTLEKRGQPAVTFNRIKRKINALQGLEKQTRKDPKAFPRNPDDQAAADAATDAIRYVCEDSRWDDKRSECAKDIAIEGTAAIMVGVKAVKTTKAGLMGGTSLSPSQQFDPEIRRIAWDRFYYDPHSSEFDFADAKFMGVVVWMELDEALDLYPDAQEALEGTWKQAQASDTYDDKPKHNLWADYRRRRVRLCEHYYKDAEGWKYCIFTKGGYVVEPQPSPYIGDDGEPECPIKAVSLYIDRDNNRYGEVRTMIGPQDEINKRRSKALHLISQRQVRVSPAVSDDPDKVRKELARPDGVFVGEQGDVEILQTSDMAAANLQMLQEAKAEIDLLGPNAAMQGKNETAMSGRALLAQQQGGMTESATYLDRVRVLSLAVYRSVWSRIRQFWKEERWVRVTDNEQNLRFVGINQPVTMIQALAKQMGVSKDQLPQLQQAAEQGDPQAGQILQQLQAFAQDPRSQQVVDVENNVSELDVDIIVDEGVDTPTVAAEQFDTLAKMIPGMGAVGQAPWVIEMLIQASSLRNKDALIKKMQEAQQQGPSPEEQQMKQLQMVGAQAEVENTQADTVKTMAEAEKIKTETVTGAFSAGFSAAA